MPRVILASASPRRKELLAQIGIIPEIIPSSTEETVTSENPADIVRELSAQKCRDVASRADGDAIVIGSDTIVTLGGEILGKPADEADAFRMLSELQGRTHEVYTGVTLNLLRDGVCVREEIFFEKTEVMVAPMSEEEIRAYIRSGDPMDKAGAYGIQGAFARHIEGIRGDYFTVVGLPLCRLWQAMQRIINNEAGEDKRS